MPRKPPSSLQQINDLEAQLESPDSSHDTGTTKPTTPKPPCIFGAVLHRTTLVGGLKSGNFSHRGVVKTMEKCQSICCQHDSCDVAIMMKGACFIVSCKNEQLCKPRKAQLKDFSLKLSFRKRPGKGKFIDLLKIYFLQRL